MGNIGVTNSFYCKGVTLGSLFEGKTEAKKAMTISCIGVHNLKVKS